jgi:hypothetical protein
MDPRDPSERVVMNTTTNDAHEAYRAAREDLDKRLNRINHLVRTHAEEQFKDKKNWGFVGDMNYVIEILDQAVEFLGGTKETSK